MAGFSHDDIDKLFTYRKWTDSEVARYAPLRGFAKDLAHAIISVVPSCPEQTLAIRALHECSMLVNVAATLHPEEES